MKRITSSLVMLTLLFSSFLIVTSNTSTAYISHAPIDINSNGDFNAAHGVSGGSGTMNDPWVIENLIIDSNLSSSYCISISGTSDCFIIRNCALFNSSYFAINIQSLQNGIISNNTIKYNKGGIMGISVSNVLIEKNTITNNSGTNDNSGIFLFESNNNIIKNNFLHNNGFCGIDIEYSDNIDIITNGIDEHIDFGIYYSMSGGIEIKRNEITNCKYALFLVLERWEANENNIQGNTLSFNEYGIYVYGIDGNNFRENTISNNTHGVFFWETSDTVLIENRIINNEECGIYLDESPPGSYLFNEIKMNNITGNGKGIWLNNSNENNIYENIISFNSCGIQINYSSDNLIYHNNLIENTNQASDDGSNSWNEDYPTGGNYWSDYNGSDCFVGVYNKIFGNDYIGDVSYLIDADETDRYPLIFPFWMNYYEEDPTEYMIDLGENRTVYENDTLNLDIIEITKSEEVSNYTWMIRSNESIVLLFDENPYFCFQEIDNYTVSLNVSYSNGFWRNDSVSYSVRPAELDPLLPNDWWPMSIFIIVPVVIALAIFMKKKQPPKTKPPTDSPD